MAATPCDRPRRIHIRLLRGLATLAFAAGATAGAAPYAFAQSLPILERPEPTAGAPTGVKIPVDLPDVTEVLGSEASGNTSPPASVPVDQPINPDEYVCGPGDVFEIVFWGKQNFRLQIAANLEGNVFISKIGFVKVTGKSLTAVRSAVRKEVKRSYPGLAFDLTLMRPRTFLVTLIGETSRPGSLEVSATSRASEVLAETFFTPIASRRNVEVLRRTADGTEGEPLRPGRGPRGLHGEQHGPGSDRLVGDQQVAVSREQVGGSEQHPWQVPAQQIGREVGGPLRGLVGELRVDGHVEPGRRARGPPVAPLPGPGALGDHALRNGIPADP